MTEKEEGMRNMNGKMGILWHNVGGVDECGEGGRGA